VTLPPPPAGIIVPELAGFDADAMLAKLGGN